MGPGMSELHYEYNLGAQSLRNSTPTSQDNQEYILPHRIVTYERRILNKQFKGGQFGPPFPNITSRFHLRRSSSSFGWKTEAVLSAAFFAMSLPFWVTEASFFLALFMCLTPQKAASALPYLTLCISTPRSLKALQKWWKFCKGEAR